MKNVYDTNMAIHNSLSAARDFLLLKSELRTLIASLVNALNLLLKSILRKLSDG
jgi:hypothetical protein